MAALDCAPDAGRTVPRNSHLSAVAWLLALGSLPTAAALVPPEADRLAGLALAGVLFWLTAHAQDAATRPRDAAPSPRAAGPLRLAAAVEALGLGASLAGNRALAAQAPVFALALGLALMGLAGLRRHAAREAVLAAQWLFHALVVPALVVLFDLGPNRAFGHRAPGPGPDVRSGGLPLLVGGALPVLVGVFTGALIQEFARRPADRDLPAAVLLAQQLACLVLIGRWAFGAW